MTVLIELSSTRILLLELLIHLIHPFRIVKHIPLDKTNPSISLSS